jgi:hypothetical protein
VFAQDILANAVAHQRPGWHAKRYKKFPRFSIYLSKGDAKEFLERNYISLSTKVIQFLAKDESEEVIEAQSNPTHTEDSHAL